MHGQLSKRNAEQSCASSPARILQQQFEVVFEAMVEQNQLQKLHFPVTEQPFDCQPECKKNAS